ncbi:MAG: NADH-quinone oxidoreductase subunit B family protein [Candidatus Asgardarchaeia archaeon]
MSKIISWARKKSPWIMHVPAGGCNACDIEVVAALTPRFDVERFGIIQKGSPRHADILIVTGPVTTAIKERLKRIYEMTPKPVCVIAVGSCAVSGGIFGEDYGFAGPLDKIIPVDIYIPGCPPRPQAIIDGVIKALDKLSSSTKPKNIPEKEEEKKVDK